MINNDITILASGSGVDTGSTTDNRTISTSILFEGLIKRQTYNFYVEGQGGNHPAIVLPNSGIFTAQSKEKTLDFNVVFCKNDIECPDGTSGLLTYTDTITNKPIYNSFRVKLEADGDATYSDAFFAVCSGCSYDAEETSSIDITPSDNFSELRINKCQHGFFDIQNLKPKTSYFYNIEANDSSWPTVVTPTSGTFDVFDNRAYKLPVSLCSCANTGLCPSDTEGLLPYSNNAMDYLNQTYKVNGMSSASMLRGTSWNLRLKENTADTSGTVAIASVYTTYIKDFDARPTFRNLSVDSSKIRDGIVSVDFDIIDLDPYMNYILDFDKTNSNWYVSSEDLVNLNIPGDLVMMDQYGIVQPALEGTYHTSIDLQFLSVKNSGNANVFINNLSDSNAFVNLAMRIKADADSEQILLFEQNIVIDGVNGPNIQIDTTSENGIFFNTTKTSVTDLKYNMTIIESNWPIVLENQTGLLNYGPETNGLFDTTIDNNIEFCVNHSRCSGADGYVAPNQDYDFSEEKYVDYSIALLDLDDNIFFESDTIRISAPPTNSGPSVSVSSNIN